MTDISLDIDWIRHIPTFQIHEPINIHTYNAGGRIRVEIPRVIIHLKLSHSERIPFCASTQRAYSGYLLGRHI